MNESVSRDLEDIRRDYALEKLSESDAPDNPYTLFDLWLGEALDAGLSDATSAALSTCGKDGQPASRIVLLKESSPEGFVFFTNYESDKGREIEENPKACLAFYWSALERQTRIDGSVTKISREASAAYFAKRPRDSQIGAWVSDQSREVPNREYLEKRIEEFEAQFEGVEVPCPPHWGGYLIQAQRIEFWQGGPGRVHDRVVYFLEDDQWRKARLAP